MGIKALLQALKPYVEPVHVSKYSGQRVGIDAYSWLHKGAYACSWQQLQEADRRQIGDKVPFFVTYCVHRIKMLRHNNVTPVVVFDGGRLPLKALTQQNRQRGREENLQKAEQKLAEGDLLSAADYFQKAVEITPQMAYELIKVLREEGVDYVVAPYEADAQLAHLSTLSAEEGGISIVITEDSDMLAYGCNVVLFKMDKFGNGEELCLDKILQPCMPTATGMSFRYFTQDLFLAMCILAGCDFLASIPGIGVKKAHALLAKYRNINRVLSKLKHLKHKEFPEDYITNFWQAKACFKHARVYDRKTKCLKLLNPLPDDLLKEFGGDIEFLGPDLPESRARAIAIGQLDPTTMCSFDALPPLKVQTPFTTSKTPGIDFAQNINRESLKVPKMEPLEPLGTSFSRGSQVTWEPCSKFPQLGPVPIKEIRIERSTAQAVLSSRSSEGDHMWEYISAELGLERSSAQAVMSSSSPEADPMWEDIGAEVGLEQQISIPSSQPEVDHMKYLAEFKPTAFFAVTQDTGPKGSANSEMSSKDVHNSALRQNIPNNNPFRSRQRGESSVSTNSPLSPDIRLECKDGNSGLHVENTICSLISSAEESQLLTSSGQELISDLNSFHFSSSSPSTSPEPRIAGCTSVDQSPVKESLAQAKSLDCCNFAATQCSNISGNGSVLADISPNTVALSPVSESLLLKTPNSAPLPKIKDPSFETSGKMATAKSISRLSLPKSASHADRRKGRGKRSRVNISEALSETKGGIARFFQPIKAQKT